MDKADKPVITFTVKDSVCPCQEDVTNTYILYIQHINCMHTTQTQDNSWNSHEMLSIDLDMNLWFFHDSKHDFQTHLSGNIIL